ncbi:MAG: SMP-30/gluconolactonase/LRE family protein [Bacteroidota bacterium]
MKIETVTNHLCVLGEGPVWDAARNEIIWVDIIEGAIHQYSFANESLKTFSMGEFVGCVAICNNGDLIFASKFGIGLLDRNTGIKKMLHHPEKHLPFNRFNDGKCDVAGRLWAGTMAIDETIGAGSVYVNDLQKSDKKISNTTISNGIAWNADNTILYFIDTPTFELVSYQFNKIKGDISNRKVVIQIPHEDGHPDGMTIDTEGMLWIAHWDGWQITRWDPNTGKKISHIKLPVSRVTSCTFGGSDLTDLYITSARKGLTDEALKEQPLAGSLFVIRNCGYQGLPAFEFNNLN